MCFIDAGCQFAPFPSPSLDVVLLPLQSPLLDGDVLANPTRFVHRNHTFVVHKFQAACLPYAVFSGTSKFHVAPSPVPTNIVRPGIVAHLSQSALTSLNVPLARARTGPAGAWSRVAFLSTRLLTLWLSIQVLALARPALTSETDRRSHLGCSSPRPLERPLLRVYQFDALFSDRLLIISKPSAQSSLVNESALAKSVCLTTFR